MADEVRAVAPAVAEEMLEAQSDLRAFSIVQVMELLDATEYMVRKMISEGTLETVRPTPGTVRITRRSLRKFLEGAGESDKLASL